MQVKKVVSIVLAVALAGCVGINAAADCAKMESVTSPIVLRATGHFDIEVPAKTLGRAGTSFPMEYGETVTIKAAYSPFSASVDFGLIDSNGTFYHFTGTGGNIDKTIKISSKGNYTFAVRNNESYPVSVSGYVNY